jgi:4-hydroxy-3-methylbut-2-en-1-yl diphosphate reductase
MPSEASGEPRVDRVLLCAPRGFCAGVEMAIKALAWMVRVFEPPVFCYHEIVHNRHVVEQFRARGVIFVDDVNEVPAGAPLMLSAHGSAPQVVSDARKRGRVVVNAVCPLVTKVHHELKVRARSGYTVLYVGHEGHEEAIGTMAVAPEAVVLVQSEDDVDFASAKIEKETPVALLAQTTLSHDEWSAILARANERFSELWMPNRSDLCFATTNRQAALRAIAGRSDTVVVIGSLNSSNTRALEAVAIAAGCPRVIRVNDATELPQDLSGTVGVTAGASAPDELVEAVLAALDPEGGIEEVRVTVEDEYFPPPPELRELLKGLSAALELGLGAMSEHEDPGPTSAFADDRSSSAADVLALLAS